MGNSILRGNNRNARMQIMTINIPRKWVLLFDQMVDEGEALNRSDLIRMLLERGLLLHRAFHDTVMEKLKVNIQK